MDKHERLKAELQAAGFGKMKAIGASMLPIFKLRALLTLRRQESYVVGNIVCCKEKGCYTDAHKIVAVDANKGYLIANNQGFKNEWARQLFDRAARAEFGGQAKE